MDNLMDTAKRIALRLGHPHVGLEHWLLAALEPPDESCREALSGARVELVELRAVLEHLADRHGGGEVPLEPDPDVELGPLLQRLAGESSHIVVREALGTPHISECLRSEAIDVDLVCELLERKSAAQEQTEAPFLDQYCVDITEQARRGSLDPVFGRSLPGSPAG